MTPEVENPYSDDNEPVHAWFGLTYSNYLVLHRTLMQSMPGEWQQRMVQCLVELQDAFVHVEQPDSFKVQPAEEREVWDMKPAEMARAGITSDEEDGETVYHDEWADELHGSDRVLLPVRRDPVPHYQRGRTRIEPWGGAQS